MKRAVVVAFLLYAFVAASSAAVEANTVLSGTVGQTFYEIVVPDSWNGDLVIWNHGFTLDPIGPVQDLGPLWSLQLVEGYAIAAASYRMSGWALFKSSDDLQAMYDLFVSRFGAPQKVLVTGASLGGLVTAAALEQAQLGNVAGAYSMCGAVAGSRNWDGGLDARLVYDALCSDVSGAYIPGGAEGLPAGSTLTAADVFQAVNECFGVLMPPSYRTSDQQSRLATFTSITHLPENFVVTDMWFATLGLSDLVHDQQKLKGRIGVGNANVIYGDPVLDATIQRVTPQPGAADRLHESYTPTGAVGTTKIVSLHTDKDGLIVVENESDYASRVPASNLTTAIVVEAAPTHCGFTAPEIVAGWESLRAWVGGGLQPTAATLQGTCVAIAPSFGGGACRIDPEFIIPALDDRIRPRD